MVRCGGHQAFSSCGYRHYDERSNGRKHRTSKFSRIVAAYSFFYAFARQVRLSSYFIVWESAKLDVSNHWREPVVLA